MTRTINHAFALFAVLALALGATACAPSPDEVCDHVIEVGELPEDFKADCVESVEKEKENMGYFDYREQANCILDADDMEGIQKCDE